MAYLPAAPNRFRAEMHEGGHVWIPRDIGLIDLNVMEKIGEFVEALLEIAHERVDIDVRIDVLHGLAARARWIDRLCDGLKMTRMTTVSLIGGDTPVESLVSQMQQDELTSTFLRNSVAWNGNVRELILSGVRVDGALALVLQDCKTLARVEFRGCQVIDLEAQAQIDEALPASNVESLVFAMRFPLTLFEADVLAAARDCTKLMELTLTLWPEDNAEQAFFEGNSNELEWLTISFSQDQGPEIASRRLGSTLNHIRESPIRIHNIRLQWGRLESQDAPALLSLVNSEERCLRQLSMDLEIALEAMNLILRGLRGNRSLTKLVIVKPGLQDIGFLFGDMLRQNTTLQELFIDCDDLRNDDAAAIFAGLENNQSLQLLDLKADRVNPSLNNLLTRQTPLHLKLRGEMDKHGLERIREAIGRGCRLTGLELSVPHFVDRATWTRFFQTVRESTSLRALSLYEFSMNSFVSLDRWGDGLRALIDSMANFRNLTILPSLHLDGQKESGNGL